MPIRLWWGLRNGSDENSRNAPKSQNIILRYIFKNILSLIYYNFIYLNIFEGHPEQPLLPLLRLRIEHENEQQFTNARQLELKLGLDKLVGNPDEVIKIVKKRAVKEKIEADVDEEALDAVFNMESINMIDGQLENLLVEYFQESTKKPMLVMHERTLAETVRCYVEKVYDDAFGDVIV